MAKPGFRDPKKLWGDYWQRYNTITIPLQDGNDYFADAIAAARCAKDRDHLEELLDKKSKERRESLECLSRKVAHASTYDMDRFRSNIARELARQVGRERSLQSFLQFICDAVWTDADNENDPSRIKAAEEERDEHVSAGGGIPGDGQPDDGATDLSGVGYDEYADENHRGLSPDPMEFWGTGEDDVWNETPWRVEEWDGSDGEPGERESLPAPSTSRQGMSLIEGGGATDDPTRADMEVPQAVHDQAAENSRRVPSASPEAPSLTRGSSAPSHLTNDASTNRVPSVGSDSNSATPSRLAGDSGVGKCLSAASTSEVSRVCCSTRACAPRDGSVPSDRAKPRAPVGPDVTVKQTPTPAPATPPLATEDDRPAAKAQLWVRAYDAIRDDDPDLVATYEAVLLSELRPEPECDVGEGGDDNPEDARRQMDRLVREGLRRTERAAAKMDNIHEGMRVVSSVQAFISTAVMHAPEAAAAWAGICLLFRVGILPNRGRPFLIFLDP